MSKVLDAVNLRIVPEIEKLGYEVVDVEYVKQHEQMNLTFYIFAEGGVTLDDCEKVHLFIDPLLDELNPTGDAPYVLNVSSPGLDRPFKKDRDFIRNYGTEVEIKLYAPLKGKKTIEGVLKEKRENAVVVSMDGADTIIELNKIVFVRPLVKFE